MLPITVIAPVDATPAHALAAALSAERRVGPPPKLLNHLAESALDIRARALIVPEDPDWLAAIALLSRPLHGRPVLILAGETARPGPLLARLWRQADAVIFPSASVGQQRIAAFGAPRRSVIVDRAALQSPPRSDRASAKASREAAAALRQFVQEVAEHQRAVYQAHTDRTKRALDLVAAGAGLALVWPVLLGAAAAIRVSMGGPVLFRQRRPGKNGVPFNLVKFRTMRHAKPHETGPEADGDRLTRLGRFLRTTSIDELPTLLNVLRGDMSLVGPRPLLMRYLDRYSNEQARRHEVVPGVTGWAQVNGRNRISWEDKFALDVFYVDNRALAMDLRILIQTALSVLRRADISQQDHATMSEFMGAQSRRAGDKG